jgi:hypothetical protein
MYFVLIIFILIFLEFWNESSEFPLFLMRKFTLIYECFGLRACFWNELCSQTKVPLYKTTQHFGNWMCFHSYKGEGVTYSVGSPRKS